MPNIIYLCHEARAATQMQFALEFLQNLNEMFLDVHLYMIYLDPLLTVVLSCAAYYKINLAFRLLQETYFFI